MFCGYVAMSNEERFRVKIEKVLPRNGDRYEVSIPIFEQYVDAIDVKGIVDVVNDVQQQYLKVVGNEKKEG